MSAHVNGRLSKYVVIRGKILVACPCLFLVRKSCVKIRPCHLPVNHIPNLDQPSCQCYCHSGDLEGGGKTHHNFLLLPGKAGIKRSAFICESNLLNLQSGGEFRVWRSVFEFWSLAVKTCFIFKHIIFLLVYYG